MIAYQFFDNSNSVCMVLRFTEVPINKTWAFEQNLHRASCWLPKPNVAPNKKEIAEIPVFYSRNF